MKKNFLARAFTYAVMVAALSIPFTSCSSDDDDNNDKPGGEIVLDGIYIKGDATALTELNSKGTFSAAKNEVLGEVRDGLYEIYVAVKKGDAGFNIVSVAGSTTNVMGPDADFAEVEAEDRNADEPQDGSFQKGGIEVTEAKFTVPEDGLYHVAYDSELNKVAIAEVVWGVIGAATPGGWGSSTVLPMKKFDLNKIEFEAPGVELSKGDYKFRYSNGWKLFLDTVLVVGDGEKGVTVNSNFGGALDALDAGGENIIVSEGGLYTINFTWELAKAPVAKLTKTGELEIADYSAVEMGIVGNSYNNAEGELESWGANYPEKTMAPDKDGDVYTWNYTDVTFVENPEGAQFKFREGEGWDGKSIGFNDVELEGNAKDSLETNNDGNFVFKGDDYAGVYTLKLVIDAATETYTLTIDKN